jgi:preprotein translocase subunit SecG
MSNVFLTAILVVHVLVALGIIGLVLLQHGKGADMGASFGGGASGSLFGATGSANFLSRFTAILAAIFFMTSLGLAYVATNKPRESGVMDGVKEAPAVPAPSAADKPASGSQSADEKPSSSKANEVPK